MENNIQSNNNQDFIPADMFSQLRMRVYNQEASQELMTQDCSICQQDYHLNDKLTSHVIF